MDVKSVGPGSNLLRQLAEEPVETISLQVTRKAELNAASLMSAMMHPTQDGIYVIGAVAVKAAEKAVGALRTISSSSWGFWALAVVGLSTFTSGCLELQLVDAGDTTAIVKAPSSISNNAVCDPFASGVAGSDLNHGVVGELYYLSDDQPRATGVQDILNIGHKVDATLFMGKLDTPTRKFDQGFFDQEGSVIQNHNGQSLYEYFALDLKSVLKLAGNDASGTYQFAVLSDDGAVLEINKGAGFETLVNNDGTHPTMMKCSTQAVTFNPTSRFPIRMRYHQGPRFHIALTVLWRPWPTNPADVNDVECGRSGNDRYFNYNVSPSAPTATFNGLLNRGWKVVSANNYMLPDEVVTNPCVAAATPQPITTLISKVTPADPLTNQTTVTFEFNSTRTGATFTCALDNAASAACTSPKTYTGILTGQHNFKVSSADGVDVDATGASYTWEVDAVAPGAVQVSISVTSSSIRFDWVTNKPTTTKLLWGLGSDTSNVVPDNGVLSTNHSVTITGLESLTIYSVKMAGTDQFGVYFESSRNGVRTAP